MHFENDLIVATLMADASKTTFSRQDIFGCELNDDNYVRQTHGASGRLCTKTEKLLPSKGKLQ